MVDQGQPSVAFHTLGCKVNQHDSAFMAGLFDDAGYRVVPFTEKADVYVINTCTVTHLSDRKSRQMIRRAAGNNPAAVIAVCGCYAQTASKELEGLPEVDVIIGTNERARIVEAVETFRLEGVPRTYLPDDDALMRFEPLPHKRVSDRTRATVKVQEGCDQFCAYCIIPYARGPLRSRDAADTVAEIRQLVAEGYREVVLTGIHLGAYGKGFLDATGDLDALCEQILEETNLARLRLGSIEVTEVTPRLIALLTDNERMAKHLHVPLQSGSDHTLKQMQRPYDTAFFRDVVRTLRGAIPRIALTTDVMVGFPGETEDHFKESLIFANDIAFSDMHVFKYSLRTGTPAARMPEQIASPVKEKRAKQMAEVAHKNAARYAGFFVGETHTVLFEENLDNGTATGHTSHYLRVSVAGTMPPGTLAPVRMTAQKGALLYGEVVADGEEA